MNGDMIESLIISHQRAEQHIEDLIAMGGLVMWPLPAVSLVLWTLVLERYWYLLRVFPAYIENNLSCARVPLQGNRPPKKRHRQAFRPLASTSLNMETDLNWLPCREPIHARTRYRRLGSPGNRREAEWHGRRCPSHRCQSEANFRSGGPRSDPALAIQTDIQGRPRSRTASGSGNQLSARSAALIEYSIR